MWCTAAQWEAKNHSTAPTSAWGSAAMEGLAFEFKPKPKKYERFRANVCAESKPEPQTTRMATNVRIQRDALRFSVSYCAHNHFDAQNADLVTPRNRLWIRI